MEHWVQQLQKYKTEIKSQTSPLTSYIRSSNVKSQKYYTLITVSTAVVAAAAVVVADFSKTHLYRYVTFSYK